MTPSTPARSAAIALPCPVCSRPARSLFHKYGHAIHDCGGCGHRFTPAAKPGQSSEHLNEVYGDAYFSGGEAGYPDYLAEAQLLRRHGRRYARKLRPYLAKAGQAPGQMLDVGAAAGFILQGFVDEGWSGAGVEPNDSMADYGRSQLRLPIQTGSLETLNLEQLEQLKESGWDGSGGSGGYDLVSMIQVVAHFYDLQRAFAIAAAATKPGGFWLIETWNRESWTAKLLGPGWHEYSPPSVLHWFSPRDLAQLAQQFGFEEVARGRPVKRISGAHAKSLLRYKLAESAWSRWSVGLLELMPDGLEIPYPAEDLFWSLYQKR